MEKVVVEQLVERVFTLLREKLGVRGGSLEARVRRAGRILPRHVRVAARELVSADQMAQEPKMLLRLDPSRVSAAYETCTNHLEGIDEKALKSKAIFEFAATVIVQVLVIGAIALAVLHWRGFF